MSMPMLTSALLYVAANIGADATPPSSLSMHQKQQPFACQNQTYTQKIYLLF